MRKKYKILIADDHNENRLLLKRIIESKNYTVVEAENGKTALELTSSETPDIIISDILMPVMDGYKFCMEVKNDPLLKKIPFIFYTATYTEKKDEEFALSLGAIKFIIKPQQPEFLARLIEETLEEYERGLIDDSGSFVSDEKETYKLYSERLVNKLEEKMAELEEYKLKLEEMVKERTAELEKKNKELERFNKIFVEREFRIKELKDRIKELEDGKS